jgi:diguanylate cyclase (GGDEF)-like protein/PAS domain S-box-containing protein
VTSRPTSAARARARFRSRLPVLATVLVVLWSLTWGLAALRLREQVLVNGLNSAELQARSFEDYLTQSLRTIELSAPNFEIRLQTEFGPDDSVEDSLLEVVRSAPYLRSLSIADASGHIVASSHTGNMGQTIDLGLFYPQADARIEVIRIGTTQTGRDWGARATSTPHRATPPVFVPVIAPLHINNGTPTTYWLVAALNPDQFVNHATQLQGARQGEVLWFRYDGQALWASDALNEAEGHRAFALSLADKMDRAEFGQFERTLPTGRQVLSAYRASSRYPAAVLVDLDQATILAPWRDETQRRLVVVLPAAALVLALTLAYVRRQRQLHDADLALIEQQELAAKVFHSSSNAILITTPDACIVSVNPAFEALTGYSTQEAIGQNPSLLSSGLHDKAFYAQMWTTLQAHQRWKGRITNRRRDGSLYQSAMTINVIRDSAGHIHHYAAVMEDITDKVTAEQTQQDNLQRLELVLQGGDLGYWDWHIPSDQVVVNERLMGIMGLAMNEIPLTIESWRDRVHPDDAPTVQTLFTEHLAGHTPFFRCEIRMQHKLGHWVWVQNMGQIVERDAKGRPIRMVGTHLDITARREALEKLRLAASVFDHALEAIMIASPQGVLIDVNESFSRITGYGREEAVGQHTRMLSSGHQNQSFYAAMWSQLLKTGHWSGEIWNRRKSGEVYVEMLTISAVQDEQGQVLRYVALFSDISQQKEHEKKLERIAHFDALTGLPNRVLLSDRLLQVMANVRRRNRCVGVVFLDLDGFKAVNDTHGHAMGDQLLVVLAQRLSQSLREGDTLARLGGDEFVAVLQDLNAPEDSLPVLERLRTGASAPLLIDGVELQVSASLGVSFYPQSEDISADQLLRQADQAMYQAKLSGKNRYHVFDDRQDRELRDRNEDMHAIRQALAREEFVLHYQPKVNMHTGQVLGVEALIRWHHPTRGLLQPAEFLPGIETHELIVNVGDWVMTTALQQMTDWKAQGLHLPVSVNVDGQQLQQADFMVRFKALLARFPDVRPGDLQLEVLETTALQDIDHVSQVMRQCRDIGVSFALDDFGTGYSSLTYLKRLPAQDLKIDQSFIRNMLDDADDLAILQGVLGLATAFQRGVVAEGIETVAHGQMLLRLGCLHGQGYAIARPMSGSELPDWVNQWRPDPSWLAQQPVHPHALTLLYAAADHRAWVRAVCDCAAQRCTEPPTLSPDECRFGLGLANIHEQLHPRHTPQLASIAHTHRCLHQQAQALLADSATPSVTPLQATSELLHAQLMQLAEAIRDERTGPDPSTEPDTDTSARG